MEQAPIFLELESGNLFALHFQSSAPPRSRILIVPPFAEELNKCRHMMARVARRLCEESHDVLIPDLYGTGDSEGDFGEASWSNWLNNLIDVHAWFSKASRAEEQSYLPIRSGMLLVWAAALRSDAFASGNVVALQPLFNGKLVISQFLRLRVMAAKLAGIEESQTDFDRAFSAGESVEVAGYTLAPSLVTGFRDCLVDPEIYPFTGCTSILEFRSGENAKLTKASENFVSAMMDANSVVTSSVINAEPFWQTTEVFAPESALEAAVEEFRTIGARSK